MHPQGQERVACVDGAAEGSRRAVAAYPIDLVRRADAVERLFPPGVVAFEIRGGVASPDDLLFAERACIARSVEKRAREFAAGRLCARAGLSALGFPPAALLSAPDRTPVWPDGIAGSITHTDGYCVAVVAPREQFAAIGIDAERIADVSASLWPLTMHTEEQRRLQGLPEPARQRLAATIFSAKEAFYKCQYALTRRWLGFDDVVVDAVADAFEVSVVQPTHPLQQQLTPWIGRFVLDETLVIAAVAAKARDLR